METTKKYIIEYARKNHLNNFILALQKAEECHEGEKRHSGRPYFSHVIDTCFVLICFYVRNDNILAAAALHDVVEHGKMTIGEIAALFGRKTAELVDIVSKIGGISSNHYFWRISLFLGAVLIKSADRLSNISDMAEVYSLRRLGCYIAETEDFIIPLLNRAMDRKTGHFFALLIIKRLIEAFISINKKFFKISERLKMEMRENRKLKNEIKILKEKIKE